MIIRSANENDIPAIRSLWNDCFGDPYEYIDFFLKNRFNVNYCAILEDRGEVIGMIHLLPCILHPEQKALYWYAAGIRSDRRKEGLFRKLALYVKEQTNLAGYSNVCVPAPGLVDYYKKLGFSHAFYGNDEIYSAKNGTLPDSKIPFEDAVAEDFLQTSFSEGDTVWDLRSIVYAISENSFCNGYALKFNYGDSSYYCIAVKNENGFLIDDHNIPKQIFLSVQASLFEKLNCDQLIFRTKGEQKILGLCDSNLVNLDSKITFTLA